MEPLMAYLDTLVVYYFVRVSSMTERGYVKIRSQGHVVLSKN
jgi:hypothetical protein